MRTRGTTTPLPCSSSGGHDGGEQEGPQRRADTLAARSPAIEYVAPTPVVACAAPSSVIEYVAPAPVVFHAAPATVIERSSL